MKPLILTITTLLIVLAHPGYAEEQSHKGAYAGIKTGIWKYTGDVEGSLSSSSIGVFAGYKFNPYLAVELDYLHNTAASASAPWKRTNTTESNSYIFALRPILPLNQHWELFGKLGWEHYRYNQTITKWESPSTCAEGGNCDFGLKLEQVSETKSGERNVFSQGLGIAYNKDHYSIRAEVQGDKSFDFRVYSIGVSHSF